MNTNDFGRFLRGYTTQLASKEDYKLWLFEMLNLPLFGINCFVYTIFFRYTPPNTHIHCIYYIRFQKASSGLTNSRNLF